MNVTVDEGWILLAGVRWTFHVNSEVIEDGRATGSARKICSCGKKLRGKDPAQPSPTESRRSDG